MSRLKNIEEDNTVNCMKDTQIPTCKLYIRISHYCMGFCPRPSYVFSKNIYEVRQVYISEEWEKCYLKFPSLTQFLAPILLLYSYNILCPRAKFPAGLLRWLGCLHCRRYLRLHLRSLCVRITFGVFFLFTSVATNFYALKIPASFKWICISKKYLLNKT
jgi:hypothetical protein